METSAKAAFCVVRARPRVKANETMLLHLRFHLRVLEMEGSLVVVVVPPVVACGVSKELIVLRFQQEKQMVMMKRRMCAQQSHSSGAPFVQN